MHDQLWNTFNGSLGVTLFFAISGFLITTLLLREEKRHARISLSNFYIRRIFRIVPLYAVALLLFSVLVLGFAQGQGAGNYLDRLPLLATFNGEFAGSGTFSHSWSLGIEEKFYVLWPLLAFGLPLCRRLRAIAVAVLVPLAAIFSFLPGVGYLGIYLPIIGGCGVALAANSRAGFRYVHALARPIAAYFLFAVMVVLLVFDRDLPLAETSRYAHTLFGIAAILVLPGVLLSNTWIHKFLAHRALAFYGTRAYALYLFHPLCLEVVDRVIPAGSNIVYLQLARFAMLFALSLLTAEVIVRVIETPFIRIGRRLTTKPVRGSTHDVENVEPTSTTSQTQPQ